MLAQAVASTVRVVLRTGYGTFATGWVFAGPVPGLGAILVNRHLVPARSAAKAVRFNFADETLDDEINGHQLLSCDAGFGMCDVL